MASAEEANRTKAVLLTARRLWSVQEIFMHMNISSRYIGDDRQRHPAIALGPLSWRKRWSQ